LPFIKDKVLNYARLAFWEENPSESIAGRLIYVLVVIFIVTAVSNSVNITDGLDGLAAGTSAITALTLGVFAYISGNIFFADYLKVSFIPLSGELLIFCAAMVGACVGFLWYNTFPAQVFMGDTGSLALGSAVGVLALMVKKELLLPLLCGVFFLESLSVIIQVGYFRYTKKKYGEGRRIFKMAPVHHHFELSGLHESKIVTRFWILTIMLSILAFATLKLR
jgi:phospho-N-acetylmuramoyl-pentapeptide-transferase